MKEYIPEITQMMKRLDEIKEKCSSEGTKEMFRDVVYALKDIREIIDY